MSGTVLIYGATGYTGKLIAKVAAGLGLFRAPRGSKKKGSLRQAAKKR